MMVKLCSHFFQLFAYCTAHVCPLFFNLYSQYLEFNITYKLTNSNNIQDLKKSIIRQYIAYLGIYYINKKNNDTTNDTNCNSPISIEVQLRDGSADHLL